MHKQLSLLKKAKLLALTPNMLQSFTLSKRERYLLLLHSKHQSLQRKLMLAELTA